MKPLQNAMYVRKMSRCLTFKLHSSVDTSRVYSEKIQAVDKVAFVQASVKERLSN